MSSRRGTSPTDTRALSTTPKETYYPPSHSHPGQPSPQPIRLGNGGAGPTGLLRALAEAYYAHSPDSKFAPAVEWYQNISPLTLRALGAGTLDLTLTYERDQEAHALDVGWADADVGSVLVFNDHFLLVGPASDPAGVLREERVEGAFRRLHKYAEEDCERSTKGVFFSRDDDSATNLKEREIWTAAGVEVPSKAAWYLCSNVFPADALRRAAEEGLYLLVDNGTWRTLGSEVRGRMRVFKSGGDFLRNPCHALVSKNGREEVMGFLDWMRDEGPGGGQEVVELFGKDGEGDLPLFTRARQPDFTNEEL